MYGLTELRFIRCDSTIAGLLAWLIALFRVDWRPNSFLTGLFPGLSAFS